MRGVESGLIKIGTSVNVARRHKRLVQERKEDLKVLLVLPGGSKFENELHQRFKAYRREGEWFDPNPKLFEFIYKSQVSGESVSLRELQVNPRQLKQNPRSLRTSFKAKPLEDQEVFNDFQKEAYMYLKELT